MLASQTVSLPKADGAAFRKSMGMFATGVAVVTTEVGGMLHGMTVNSLTSVSLDPVMLLVCLSKTSATAAAIRERGEFVVSLLSEDQEHVSRYFVGKWENRFEGLELVYSEKGIPMPSGCVAYMSCDIRAVHDAGDHHIVVADVTACGERPGQPLVFWRGSYGGYQPAAAA
jgi:3-hydroxy-9,10-secoandrosta-1,3,5(10)-triene-9,17-dione monooxygenase reductase component